MGYTRSASTDDTARIRSIRAVLWVILGLNLAVAAAKYFYGVATDSISMQADGFHSLFDGTSNVIGLIGLVSDLAFKWGNRKLFPWALLGR